MAALVVALSSASGMGRDEARIGIFPGGATPTMYPASTAFWIGYGFAAAEGDRGLDGDGTRFELDVDGKAATLLTELQPSKGPPVRKTDVADFPVGLPAGWHDFVGRWYDDGRLVLSSRASIEFVER